MITNIFCLHIFLLILSYCYIRQEFIDIFSIIVYLWNNFKSKRYTLQQPKCSSYKVVMYIQKLHHFCNTSSPDDGPKSARKYLGNKQLGKIYQSIPAEYYEMNTAIKFIYTYKFR